MLFTRRRLLALLKLVSPVSIDRLVHALRTSATGEVVLTATWASSPLQAREALTFFFSFPRVYRSSEEKVAVPRRHLRAMAPKV